MRKTNISTQLLLLFFSILLIGTCAFIFLTTVYVSYIANTEVYVRLTTYSQLLISNSTPNNPEFQDMEIGYFIHKNNANITYRVDLYGGEDTIYRIIDKIKEKRENEDLTNPNFYAQGSIDVNSQPIYYVCNGRNNLNEYIIIFTDSTYTRNLIKKITTQMMMVFLLLILLASCIIFLWSYRITRRIKNIQNHIINLPKNKYKEEYVDDSLDEIGELSRSIEEMRVEIGTSEQTKQDMLQNLSHDFKTPIAVIKSYAEALEDGMAGKETIKIIIYQADLLKKKVNRLLQYNSLEYLNHDKEFEEIDMKELIEEVVQNYKYQTNLTIETNLDDNILFMGYRENWHTVIDNIVDNAKRYAKTKIKIVLKPNRLRIYNDGEHIDEQFLNSIFKPYEKGSKGEFGLGMSIVKKTVDFFGYNLEVVNEEIGVSFVISK